MKKMLVIIISLIVVLGVASFFGYRYYANQKKQKQETAKADITADWQIQNTGYGVKFQIPKGWKTADVKESNAIYLFNEDSVKNGVIIDEKELARGVNNSDMTIYVDDNPNNQSPDAFFGKYDVAFKEGNQKEPREEKIINSYKTIVFPFVEAENNPIFREAIVELPGKFISLIDTKPFDKDFDLILGTIGR